MLTEQLWHVKVAITVYLLKWSWLLVLLVMQFANLVVLHLKFMSLPFTWSYQMVRMSF